jgi:2-haloacid dehalogenase
VSRWVLLDVNGTLTDLGPIGAPWGRPELGPEVLDHAVHTAMVEALLGSAARPFSDHVRAAVELVVADLNLDVGRVDDAVAAAAALPARAHADEALAMLVATGMRLVALTNSGARAGQVTLEACGLAEHVERVLGVEGAASFKPHPSVYAYALRELDARADEVTLIATHAWDLAGAARAGMRTAWVRHGAHAWPAVFPAPDVQADTLLELASAIAR